MVSKYIQSKCELCTYMYIYIHDSPKHIIDFIFFLTYKYNANAVLELAFIYIAWFLAYLHVVLELIYRLHAVLELTCRTPHCP